jgi:hypothetical protein
VTGPEIAMNTQVTTALISGGVAFVVALLGIAGAIAAQLVATRHAFSHSLALFERQRAAQETSSRQERAEATRREEEQRFADERRIAYAKFLRLADEIFEAQRAADNYNEVAVRSREKEKEDPTDHRKRATAEAERRADDCVHRARVAEDQLEEVATEIDLLATEQVRAAAGRLHLATEWAESAMLEYPDARDEFVDAARRELGIPTGDLSASAGAALISGGAASAAASWHRSAAMPRSGLQGCLTA